MSWPTLLQVIQPQASPSCLVVLLHGFGADANDLVPAAESLATSFPQAEFIVPAGPHPSANGSGFQWWDVQDMTEENRPVRVRDATNTFTTWLDATLDSRGLTSEQVVVIGFSQGATVAFDVGTQRHLAGAASWSGRGADIQASTVSTPFLLVSGGRDPWIPPDASEALAQTLRDRGAVVTVKIHPELAHGLNAAVIEDTRVFLQTVLP